MYMYIFMHAHVHVCDMCTCMYNVHAVSDVGIIRKVSLTSLISCDFVIPVTYSVHVHVCAIGSILLCLSEGPFCMTCTCTMDTIVIGHVQCMYM